MNTPDDPGPPRRDDDNWGAFGRLLLKLLGGALGIVLLGGGLLFGTCLLGR